jgi:hypothetical protein
MSAREKRRKPYQTFSADKNSKTYEARTKLKKKLAPYGTIAVNLLKPDTSVQKGLTFPPIVEGFNCFLPRV